MIITEKLDIGVATISNIAIREVGVIATRGLFGWWGKWGK
jgi:hypothetical protein